MKTERPETIAGPIALKSSSRSTRCEKGAINISGDLAGPGFAPGTHRTFTSGVYDGGDSVSVTGCSGPELGNYTFDSPGNEVEITVQSLPAGMRRMDYVVRFSDGAVTRGSFDYRIEADSGTTRSGI